MKIKAILSMSLVIILLLNFAVILGTASAPTTHNADAMWIDAPSIVFDNTTASIGTTFNVTVWLNITENVFAYQIGLHYNRTQLQCINAGLTGGTTSNYFKGHTTSPAGPTIDTSSLGNGSVLAGETLFGTDFIPGPKNASLIWVEFQVLIMPTAGNLTSNFDISTEYPSNTFVLDTNLNNINFTPYNGSYLFIGPPITAPPPLAVSISQSSTTIYAGQSVLFTSTVTGGLPPYTYQWFLNSTSVPSATAKNWTYTPPEAGSGMVYLNVTDSNATIAESNTLFITVLPPLTGAEIYVNPPQILDLSLAPGSTISINVTVANVASLGGCVFNLTYDPNVLNWIGFDFIPVQGQYPTLDLIANKTGFTWMSLYYSPAISAVLQPLVTLRFNVNSYGITLLNLTGTEVLDQNQNPLTHNTFGGIFANIIRDVAVTNVVPTSPWVYQTWTDNINVTVANLGNVTESFNVTALYNGTAIGTTPVNNLASNTQTTVTIPWDTTGVATGNYTISGTASFVPYETYFNTTNNVYVDGIVQVLTIIHDVAITNVTPLMAWAYANTTVPINVTAANLGNASETFTVTAYYNASTISTILVTNLAAGTSTTLTFDWNTTGIAGESNYTISAFASYVPFEYNTTNNRLVDGQVLILAQVRDVAITNVVTSLNSTYQGRIINITVTASNLGQVTESFNVTAFYDANPLGTVPIINLAPNASVANVFMLNTSGLMLYHNYTISAQASIVPYEVNTANNLFVDGTIFVKIIGDVNGDGKVNIEDISIIAKAFGSVGPGYLYPGSPPSPNWNPNADLNGDNRVDIIDISLAARNFGKSYP
ncbi:MAG TPA: CARDB domain-containing protein [Candidatus Acidoferrum sp.]|nr:CARDB domain-containing protein [Candidatus Acidoferrum sp.]